MRRPPPAMPTDDPLAGAELLGVAGGPVLRLRFSGPFEGRKVVWDATLIATAAAGERHANYIDIGSDGPQGIALEVGLAVAAIDLPTARKAIMMIRRYKRLRRGRHSYGG